MSHQPPVPEANQSPYPIQEPPHAHTQAEAAEDSGQGNDDAKRPRTDGQLTNLLDDLPELSGRTIVAVGGAIALGVAATVGALLFARSPSRKTKNGRTKGTRRKRAAS